MAMGSGATGNGMEEIVPAPRQEQNMIALPVAQPQVNHNISPMSNPFYFFQTTASRLVSCKPRSIAKKQLYVYFGQLVFSVAAIIVEIVAQTENPGRDENSGLYVGFWTGLPGILGAGLSIFVCWKALKSTRRGANMDFASSRNVVVTVGPVVVLALNFPVLWTLLPGGIILLLGGLYPFPYFDCPTTAPGELGNCFEVTSGPDASRSDEAYIALIVLLALSSLLSIAAVVLTVIFMVAISNSPRPSAAVPLISTTMPVARASPVPPQANQMIPVAMPVAQVSPNPTQANQMIPIAMPVDQASPIPPEAAQASTQIVRQDEALIVDV